MPRSLAQPRSRRGLVVVVLVAVGAGVVGTGYLLHEHEQVAPELVEASVADAAVDARATAKAKPGKKPAPRGGKTRVAGRASAPNAPPKKTPAATPTPTPTPTSARHDRGPTGPSYESALDGNDDQVTIGAKGQTELTDAQLSAPMSDGTFVSECGAPETTGVTVKVAIRFGHAVGVSVDTSPYAPQVNGCIDRYVRSLSWPSSPKLDSLVTSY